MLKVGEDGVHLSINNTLCLSVDDGGCVQVYDNITDELDGVLFIKDTNKITSINSFKKLETVFGIYIGYNYRLSQITGFDNLKCIRGGLYIHGNAKLISMSIPGNIIRSVNYGKHRINYGLNHNYKSPEAFINSPVIIDDMVTKFDPGDHGDQVVKQILENLEELGNQETKDTVVSYLISQGVKHLMPQELLNRYDSETIKSNNDIIQNYIKVIDVL